MKPKIGCIGYGMVGQAVGAWFKNAAIYSLQPEYRDGMPSVNKCDIVFICVPSPYSKKTGYDLTAIHASAKALTGRKIVVLKSTVLPGTTRMLKEKYPQHTWLFNPEFLVERTNVKDFLKPDRQIIGIGKNTPAHLEAAKLLLKLLPPAPVRMILHSDEAEMIKLGANAFGSMKVIYANLIYDLCRADGIHHHFVLEGIAHDPRIGGSWMNPLYQGYRGYSGKCFPKDIAALIWWAKKKKHRARLFELVDKENLKILPKRLRNVR